MQEKYKIIRLHPYGRKYCQPFSQEYYEDQLKSRKKYFPEYSVKALQENDKKEYDNYLERDIPIGASRIGGPIVDLPDDIKYPDGYYFAAQLNCKELKKYDDLNLLPQNGFIYFFTRHPGDNGIVFYSAKGTKDLRRITKEHIDWDFYGCLVGDVQSETESMETRYEIEDSKKIWNFFAGTDVTKVYGMYTNCQANEEEVKDKLYELEKSKMVLLLQIGSDFMGEGTQCIYINKKDLQDLNFSHCIFEYNQS